MISQWFSRSIDGLAMITAVYVIHVVLFYGLSVRQLAAFRATLPGWVHWTLWGSCFALMGLLWVLTTVKQRRTRQTGRSGSHDERQRDGIPGRGISTPWRGIR